MTIWDGQLTSRNLIFFLKGGVDVFFFIPQLGGVFFGGGIDVFVLYYFLKHICSYLIIITMVFDSTTNLRTDVGRCK